MVKACDNCSHISVCSIRCKRDFPEGEFNSLFSMKLREDYKIFSRQIQERYYATLNLLLPKKCGNYLKGSS